MRRKILYIACLMVAGLLHSCTNEVDDFFDSSAQQRMNEEIKACRALLTSSELGWTLDYYPSAKQSYGGYAMTVKFDETHVTAASEITGDAAVTMSSLYSLKSDMGPTLNFDTYNQILHYFADPDNTGGAGVGKGYEGDYEFVIHSRSENEIILKGKKTKNIMKMTRLTESSEDYLASVMATEEKISAVVGVLGYTGRLNGQDVSISIPSDRRMNIQVGDESLISTGFMYTADGINFYQPVEIGGKEVSSLQWSETEQTYVSEDGAFTSVPDPAYTKYERFLGEYTMKYDNNGGSIKEVPITLKFLKYPPSEKVYGVEGLPFPLEISYNVEKDCMEITTYTIQASQCYVAMWEVEGKGSLTWSPGIGMFGQLKKGTDNEYEFVDNGAWKTNKARAIILWSAAGEYKGYGGDTRFLYITFVKK